MSKRPRESATRMAAHIEYLNNFLTAVEESGEQPPESAIVALTAALHRLNQGKAPVLIPTPGTPLYRRRSEEDINALTDRSHFLSLIEPVSSPSSLIFHELPSTPPSEECPLIVTHDGAFHCDEVLACAMLLLTPRFRNARILRTRNPDLIARGTVVVDVGGEYNPETLRYDHHQRTFNDTFNSGKHHYRTRMSSSGLVYLHHGRDALATIVGAALEQYTTAATGGSSSAFSPELAVYDRVYAHFLEEVDGDDNGVPASGILDTNPKQACGSDADAGLHAGAAAVAATGEGPPPPSADAVGDLKCVARYLSSSGLPHEVKRLVPHPEDSPNAETYGRRFALALALVQARFVGAATAAVHKWLPTRAIVARAVLAASTSPHPRVVVLPQGVPGVMDHIPPAEAAAVTEDGVTAGGRTLYVIYPSGSNTGPAAPHRVHAVPAAPGSFLLRKAITAKGLREGDLNAAVPGLADGVFVHVSGFIGEAKSLDGALTLAIASVNATE